MKRFITVLIIAFMMFSFSSVYANTEEGRILLREQIFYPEELKQEETLLIPSNKMDGFGDITPNEIDPGDGTVKISDELLNPSSIVDATDKGFSDFETFKYTSVLIVTNVPGFGQYFETGLQIYDGLKAVFTDMNNIDRYKRVDVTTKYSYRDFYHWLYVWQNGDWSDMGYSLSRYYYKHTSMLYYNTIRNDFESVNWDFTLTNGYNPCVKATAPNYMNYSALSQIVHERWVYGWGAYTETY